MSSTSLSWLRLATGCCLMAAALGCIAGAAFAAVTMPDTP